MFWFLSDVSYSHARCRCHNRNAILAAAPHDAAGSAKTINFPLFTSTQQTTILLHLTKTQNSLSSPPQKKKTKTKNYNSKQKRLLYTVLDNVTRLKRNCEPLHEQHSPARAVVEKVVFQARRLCVPLRAPMAKETTRVSNKRVAKYCTRSWCGAYIQYI